MLGVSVGPFAFAAGHLILAAAAAFALVGGWWAGRRSGRNPESMLVNLLLLGLVVARVTFVVRFWPEYRDDPLQMFDVRDGGFLPWPGLLAVLVAAALGSWWRPLLRRPLGFGVACGVLVWVVGHLIVNALEESRRLPDVALHDAAGNAVRLADFAGKPLVVNLWATWCPPCRREMPVLHEAQSRHDDVVFLFANQGEGAEVVDAYLAAEGLALRHVLLDGGQRLGHEVGSVGLPTTLFYSPDGRLIDSHLGELSHGSLARYLERFQRTP